MNGRGPRVRHQPMCRFQPHHATPTRWQADRTTLVPTDSHVDDASSDLKMNDKLTMILGQEPYTHRFPTVLSHRPLLPYQISDQMVLFNQICMAKHINRTFLHLFVGKRHSIAILSKKM